MNYQIAPSYMGSLGILVMLAGLLMAAFWMVVGWRAMIAHEKIATSAEKLCRKLIDRNHSV